MRYTRMDLNPSFPPLFERSAPVHDWFWETEQYRLKLQTYTSAPPEFTIQKVDFGPDLKRYRAAAERSSLTEATCYRTRKTRIAPAPGVERDPESIERSQRRAKSQIRRLTMELAPNHFTTFTTRESGVDYLNPAQWAEMWGHFVGLVRLSGHEFEYVSVLERHPKNPQHLHLHVAWRGNVHYRILRRLWHIAVLRQKGVRVTKTQYGDDAPGNIQDQPIKAPRGSHKQVRKIARYIAKYITKDLISEFNKKRYWVSKGVNLVAARLFWLSALDQGYAIREALSLFGQWDYSIGENGACPHPIFRPSDRVAWICVDPDSTPPPPF
jgi:hypothetical protein